jgi:hypothetical protein
MRGGVTLIGAAFATCNIATPDVVRGQALPRFVAQPPLVVAVGPDAGRHAMVLADVNGDERPDLVAIDPDEGRVLVFINTGHGAFDLVATPGLIEDITPTAVAIGDVSSPFASAAGGAPDGKADIVVGGDVGEVEVLFGRGDGQFDAPESVIEPDATSDIVGLVLGDFDPGHGLDVALLDEDGLVLLCNDGFGNLSSCSVDDAIETGFDPIDIAAGDFDGDGLRDVAVLDCGDQRVWPFFNGGDQGFVAGPPIDVAGEARGDFAVDLDVGRLDGDARDDLVVANSSEFGEFLGVALFGSADRSFRVQPFVLDFDATAIAIGELTGGGGNDVVAGYAGFGGSGLTVNTGDGRGGLSDPFSPAGTASVFAASLVLTAALDQNGTADLVVLDEDGETVRVLLGRSGETGCVGDCNSNGSVSVEELLRGVNILLGQTAAGECLAMDVDRNSEVTVNELVAAVFSDLAGCPDGSGAP